MGKVEEVYHQDGACQREDSGTHGQKADFTEPVVEAPGIAKPEAHDEEQGPQNQFDHEVSYPGRWRQF